MINFVRELHSHYTVLPISWTFTFSLISVSINSVSFISPRKIQYFFIVQTIWSIYRSPQSLLPSPWKRSQPVFVYLRTVASVILAGEGRDATSADLTGNAPTREPMLANSPTNASALPRTATQKSCATSAHWMLKWRVWIH